MLDEIIAGLLAMPSWVQIGMAFFVLMVAVMFAEPRWRLHRVATRFAKLATASGTTVTPGSDKYTASFELERDGRPFTVRRELRDSTSRPAYRGPLGHLLICESPLAGSGWEQHGVDIAEDGGLPRIGSRPSRTGDAAFDQRFTAWEDGVPVRAGWLDVPARAAVTALFDTTPLSGSLRVRGERMQYVAVAPKGVDGDTLAKVLHAESVVAFAFERMVV